LHFDLATTGDGATGDGAGFTSCATLAPACGPSGSDDCCNSLPVPGGTFLREYDGMGFANMSFPATISSFRLDKYEITVGRFRAFVIAGQGTQASPPPTGSGAHPSDPATGWDPSWNGSLAVDTAGLSAALHCDPTLATWTDASGADELLPVNCIDWYEAQAFCIWDGGYLPSEAEWNYAASGGPDQRLYPWASITIDETYASYQCLADGVASCALTDVTTAGAKPNGDGMWGQSDLAGNVFEWTMDFWSTPLSTSCVDCVNLIVDPNHVVRGGSFDRMPTDLRAALRNYAPSGDRGYDRGARCARPP
jgi:formylglycine-generating enzyme required for sulfatase activity